MRKLVLTLFAIGVMVTSYAQAEIDTDQLALDVSKADAANTDQLKAFIWKKASVVSVNGEVKANTLSEFKFDDKGELQMQNIDATTSVKQKRGVRGRVQASTAQNNIDYVEKALETMITYTYMSKGQLLDFFDKAKITEANGIITAAGSDVFAKGDSLTVKVESATKLFLHKEFSGFMGEDPISGVIEYAKFKSGVSHATTNVLSLPAKKAVINGVNQDYSQRVE